MAISVFLSNLRFTTSFSRYIWTILMFLQIHSLVAANSYQQLYDRFTHLAVTNEGTPCLFNCVAGRCRTGINRDLVPCTESGVVAPTYRTIQLTSHEFCISRCGYFGENYEWCVVDSDNNWDYCSSETKIEVITSRSLTHEKKACKDECTYRGSSDLWCHTFDGSWGYCDPGVYNFIQAYTAKGHKCLFKCERNIPKDKPTNIYNRCENDFDFEEGCAPPAVPADLNKLKLCFPQNNVCKMIGNRLKRNPPGCADFDVEVFSDNVMNNPFFYTVTLTDSSNPVYSYTVLPPAYAAHPTLPLVVRARITQATLRTTPRGQIPSSVQTNLQRMGMIRNDTEENNDEAGHLIGSQFGGPDTIYNLAPQPRILNRGGGRFNDPRSSYSPSLWYHRDENIRSFIATTGGAADLIIVVVYDVARSYRPTGFLVNERLTYSNGTVYYESRNYFYNNDPACRE